MRDFAAIDFETANFERSSVCSVGIVIVRDGEMTDSFYSLIQPEPNYYTYRCSQVHGLCREDTEYAPVFPKVWEQIEPLIEGLPLVAHNKSFDEGCLKAVFRVYQMTYPDYEFYDTLYASRRAFPFLHNHQFHTVAAACGFILQTTTTPSPTPKPALGLQERYSNSISPNLYSTFFQNQTLPYMTISHHFPYFN